MLFLTSPAGCAALRLPSADISDPMTVNFPASTTAPDAIRVALRMTCTRRLFATDSSCAEVACLSRRHRVTGEFIESRGNRCLVQPATVLLPAIRGKTDWRPRSARIRQAALYPRVRPVLIEILLELSQLRLQVCGCPE